MKKTGYFLLCFDRYKKELLESFAYTVGKVYEIYSDGDRVYPFYVIDDEGVNKFEMFVGEIEDVSDIPVVDCVSYSRLGEVDYNDFLRVLDQKEALRYILRYRGDEDET
jgi:hypothetical protein